MILTYSYSWISLRALQFEEQCVMTHDRQKQDTAN